MILALRAALAFPVSVLLAASLAVAAPGSALARNYVLNPASPWQMDYSRDSCNLLREFKDEDGNDIILRLERFDSFRPMEMMLVGPLARSGNPRVEVSTTFLPGGLPTVKSHVLTGSTGGKDHMLPAIYVGQVTFAGDVNMSLEQQIFTDMTREQQAAIRTLVVDVKYQRHLELWTGSFDGPMAAMRQCTDDLLKQWGLDPAEQATLSPPAPLGSPGDWLKSKDYPTKALVRWQSGRVHFRLMVDAMGAVSDCAVQDIVPSPDFAKVTCDLLAKRARFKPATGKDGSPHASYYINTVNFLAGG